MKKFISRKAKKSKTKKAVRGKPSGKIKPRSKFPKKLLPADLTDLLALEKVNISEFMGIYMDEIGVYAYCFTECTPVCAEELDSTMYDSCP